MYEMHIYVAPNKTDIEIVLIPARLTSLLHVKLFQELLTWPDIPCNISNNYEWLWDICFGNRVT